VAWVLITAGKSFLLTNRIEAPRMEDEELLGAAGFEFVATNWYEREASAADIAGGPVGCDGPYGDTQNIANQIAPLRYQLVPDEVERYRWLGLAAGNAVQTVAKSLTPGLSEHEIAGRLGNALISGGIVPTVLLVAADERIFRYRHPLPTDKRLDRYAMLVIGARRWGLHASVTRLVHFGALSADLRRKAEATARVDATYITYTRPGARVADVFRRAQDAYAAAGYPDEWQLHHQGGACGYEGRDYKGVPGSQETVLSHQAFAWNPSIAGTKSEDTIVVSDDGFEVLTAAPGWPMLTFVVNNQAIRRPAILEVS
jgi:antitoxin VapB